VTHRVLLATRSEGKLRELRPLFGAHEYDVIDLRAAGLPETSAEDDLEHFESFEENALAKGRYFNSLSGLPVVADDSGLQVRALNGDPGVRSKRWSGRVDLTGDALDVENNALLLRSLAGAVDRAARYVCAAAFVDGPREIVRRGEATGHITRAPRGSGGFGYDPYFESDELARTFGEVPASDKERVSHRARAFRALIDELRRG
jgi:XTP/dITP diphosphohydrolase